MKHTFTLNNIVLAVLQFIFGASVFGACGTAIALFSTTSVAFNRMSSSINTGFGKFTPVLMIILTVCAAVAVCDSYIIKAISK